MTNKICLYGDSIGRGVIYNASRQRYVLAKRGCATILQEHGYAVENRARMGATVRDGLAAFAEREAEPGALVAVEYGGNDCDLDWDSVAQAPGTFHDGKVPLSVFSALLDRFVREIRARGMKPLLVVPPPLVSSRYLEWVCRGRDRAAILSYLGDEEHIYRWQERYAWQVLRCAAQAGCAVLNLRDLFLNAFRFTDLMCDDGIHPNESGHELMAEAILRKLEAQTVTA